jgi:hypothetical protein
MLKETECTCVTWIAKTLNSLSLVRGASVGRYSSEFNPSRSVVSLQSRKSRDGTLMAFDSTFRISARSGHRFRIENLG